MADAPTDELPPPVEPLDPIDDDPAGFSLPPEGILGASGVLLVLLYVVLYLRGAAAADRYAAGFVVPVCPVCQKGELIVEARQNRLLGIPRPRRIIRCDNCRSVLRETGNRRWRYAVDRLENPALYERFNGREIDEASLEKLAAPSGNRVRVSTGPVTPPSFVDDD